MTPDRSPQERAARWDALAPRYDGAMALVERRFLAGARRWICERAHGDTLEVAIGTGASIPHYPPGVRLTGQDLSPAMLDRAARRAREEGRTIELHVGDADVLPFPDGRFDTVVTAFALCGFPDERAALTEMLRVLRPGGSLLLADHVTSTAAPLRWVQRGIDAVNSRRSDERWIHRPLEDLHAMGVEVVDTTREHHGIVEALHARQ